jgi:hypothetical protein
MNVKEDILKEKLKENDEIWIMVNELKIIIK